MSNEYVSGSVLDCYYKIGLRDDEAALILSRMNRVNILLKSLLQKAINQTNTHQT